MLSFRMHQLLQIANIVGTIRQETDLLVFLEALIPQHFQEPSLRVVVQRLYKTKSSG